MLTSGILFFYEWKESLELCHIFRREFLGSGGMILDFVWKVGFVCLVEIEIGRVCSSTSMYDQHLVEIVSNLRQKFLFAQITYPAD